MILVAFERLPIFHLVANMYKQIRRFVLWPSDAALFHLRSLLPMLCLLRQYRPQSSDWLSTIQTLPLG